MSRAMVFRGSEKYVLVPAQASHHWLENAAMEFLGDVEVETFGPSALRIDSQLVSRGFAVIPRSRFYSNA